jgi:hypothetical protein
VDREREDLEIYEPPRLIQLGSLAEITQAGAGGIMEHGAGSTGATFSQA